MRSRWYRHLGVSWPAATARSERNADYHHPRDRACAEEDRLLQAAGHCADQVGQLIGLDTVPSRYAASLAPRVHAIANADRPAAAAQGSQPQCAADALGRIGMRAAALSAGVAAGRGTAIAADFCPAEVAVPSLSRTGWVQVASSSSFATWAQTSPRGRHADLAGLRE